MNYEELACKLEELIEYIRAYEDPYAELDRESDVSGYVFDILSDVAGYIFDILASIMSDIHA